MRRPDLLLTAVLARMQASVVLAGAWSRLYRWFVALVGLLRRGLTGARMATGQGLAEYGLILVLIAIVVIGAVTLVGGQISSTFSEINCELRVAVDHSGTCP